MKIEHLSFKAGNSPGGPALQLRPGTITVFIGPNNGGKSAALREIHGRLSGAHTPAKIFDDIRHLPLELLSFERRLSELEVKTHPSSHKDHVLLGLRGGERQETNLPYLRNILSQFSDGTYPQAYVYSHFMKHFVLNLNGESRLVLTNPGSGQNLKDPPQSTVAALFLDDELLDRVSEIIHEAFGQYLVIDATSMNSFSYGFSDMKPPASIRRSYSDQAIDFFQRTTPLQNASDGSKAFVGILTEILASRHDVFLIDEPEAFLHPSLAYLLGREVSRHIADDKQLFVSTHSPYFLMGAMSAGKPIDIVRLTYRSQIPTVRLLPAVELRRMMMDPLLKSIGVLSALFYESAVVVEADADRSFYDEINSRLNLSGGEGMRHSIFLNAHGKHEVAQISRVLRNVGIPAAMVFDIDWIKEDGKVGERYLAAAGIPVGLRRGLMETRRQVRTYLEGTEGDYKKNGGVSNLSGAEGATATAFFDSVASYGLFTIRRGELEHWLDYLNVSARKDRWLAKMFERMRSDPSADDYVRPNNGDVWEFMRSITRWVNSPTREGMTYVDPTEL